MNEGLSHLSSVATMASAKTSWIWPGGGHGMLGQDRLAGERLEESDMASDVKTQVGRNRLVQTVVGRR
jgi:hypothetical protein